MQNEKRKALLEHETAKLRECDDALQRELRDWKSQLHPRKQVTNPYSDVMHILPINRDQTACQFLDTIDLRVEKCSNLSINMSSSRMAKQFCMFDIYLFLFIKDAIDCVHIHFTIQLLILLETVPKISPTNNLLIFRAIPQAIMTNMH